MHRLIPGVLFIALIACVEKTPETATRFRAVSAPMWSSAQFDQGRLPGRWTQAASFASGPSPCAPGGAEFSKGDGVIHMAARLCLAGKEITISGPVKMVGPGRMEIDGQLWWILWVDTDYRTLAVATPSGAFGFVLNRGGRLPADRLTAAKEIFEFNGYDVSKLIAY